MMPEDIATQACRDGERVEAHAMHGNQSVWMAHWMHAGYKSAPPACNRLGVGCEVKEGKEDSGTGQCDLLGGLGSSMHAGAVGKAARAKSVIFTSEADNEKSKKANFGSKLFPAYKFSRKLDGRLSQQKEQHDREDVKSKTEPGFGDDNLSPNRAGTSRAGLPSTSAHFHPKPETLVEECRVLSQEVLPTAGTSRAGVLSTSAHAPPKAETFVEECRVLSQEVLPTALLMKSSLDVEQKHLAVSTSPWNDFVKSASDIVPHGRGKGKTVMPQFTREPHEVCQSSYNLASGEQFKCTKYHTYSSLLISEKKMISLLDPQRSSFSRWMQSDIAHLPHDFMAGSDSGLFLVRGQHHEIEKYVANPNIKSQSASSESTKPQIFYGLSSAVAQVPCSIHDVGSMKIYTSIDSVEESSRGPPKNSQTSHHFLMSEKTDVNLSDRAQFFTEPVAPIKMKENAFDEILDVSPPTSNHGREGLKLEAVGSSIKSEGKENVQDFKCLPCLKNESSAETDTMDIDALHKNNLPGDVPLQTNKCSKDSQNSLTSKAATNSAREKTIAKSLNTSVPDINQEPDELLTQESPVVDREPSTSRTHSLDLDHVLSHADKHARSNSGNSSWGSDPSSRWVKRLKLCTLGSAHGTESTKVGETFSHEKVNKLFGKILKDSKTSLEPKMVCQAEGQMVTDLPAKKSVEITLSHPWIQRWGHNRAASSQKRHDLGELREPKFSNAVPEEFQKKQFPSIAAMALMGKAMNSLNPSELMKKGPVIVWNMKGF